MAFLWVELGSLRQRAKALSGPEALLQLWPVVVSWRGGTEGRRLPLPSSLGLWETETAAAQRAAAGAHLHYFVATSKFPGGGFWKSWEPPRGKAEGNRRAGGQEENRPGQRQNLRLQAAGENKALA